MGVSSREVISDLSDKRAFPGGLGLGLGLGLLSWPSSFDSLNGFKRVSKSPIST